MSALAITLQHILLDKWEVILMMLIPAFYLIILSSINKEWASTLLKIAFLWFPIGLQSIYDAFNASSFLFSLNPAAFPLVHKTLYLASAYSEGIVIIALLIVGFAYIYYTSFINRGLESVLKVLRLP